MKSRNEQIVIGLLLKAQSMAPLCLIVGSDASKETLSALAASLILAFLLSAAERLCKLWTIIWVSALATSIFTLGELLWLAQTKQLPGLLARYGFFRRQFSWGPYSSRWEHSWDWFAIGRDQTITQRLEI